MNINQYQDQLYVSFNGNLCLNKLTLLGTRVNRVVDQGCRFLCLDFCHVTNMDESNFFTLLAIHDTYRVNDIKMIITGLTQKLRRQLMHLNPSPDLTILDHLLTFDDRAVKAANRSA